jgi:hypothetical protein
MELIPSWVAANCGATQELHKSPSLVLKQSQIDPVHTTPSYLSKINFNIIHRINVLVFVVVSFLLAFPPKSYMQSSPPCMLYAPPISFLTWSLKLYLARSSSYEASHYEILSNIWSLHPSSVQIFPSAPCSETPSVYVPPLMSETKFHTHTEIRVKCTGGIGRKCPANANVCW